MKSLAAALFILGLAFSLSAQPPGGPMRGEKIEKLKIAFLTDELDLSVKESQQFWPVYNEHTDERKSIDENLRSLGNKVRDAESLSDPEVTQMIEDMSMYKKQLADSEEKFLKECLPILGAQKTIKLVRAEEKFKRAILEKMQENRKSGNRRPGQRP